MLVGNNIFFLYLVHNILQKLFAYQQKHLICFLLDFQIKDLRCVIETAAAALHLFGA